MNILNSKTSVAPIKLNFLAVSLSLLFANHALAGNILKDIKAVELLDGSTAITMQFAEPVNDIEAFSTESPPRIAIDLPETSNAFAQRRLELNSSFAKSVNAVESGGRTRIVVDLAKLTQYRTQAMGNNLILTLNPKAANSNVVSISSIDFKRAENGAGRLILRFDKTNASPVIRQQGSELVLDIANAKLPTELRRQFDVAGYDTPVLNIDARDISGRARLVLNTKGKSEMMSYSTGNDYVVEISPKSAISQTGALGNSRSVSRSSDVREICNAKGDWSKSYGKLTFDFQDIPVRSVLQIIATEMKTNVVAADSVNGNITLLLDGVPAEKALDVVLRARGLDKRCDGNVLWVGPQQELASFEQAREDARRALESKKETKIEYIRISYGSAEDIVGIITGTGASSKSSVSGGGGAVTASVSGDRVGRGFLSQQGSVSFDARTNTILLIDIPEQISKIKAMVDELDKPVDQVMIEARIVVAQDSFARELGAKFGVNDRYGVDAANPGVTRDSGFNVNLPLSNPAGILNFNFLGSNTSLDIELQAMETKGRGEVVSNPRVITSNQQEASIKQGEEVGYVTTQASGTTTVPQATVEFKEVLLELKVKPTITNDGRVFLVMNVKKDEIKDFLSTPTGDVPQIQKREVNTQVLVKDGETVVIGGVYEFKNRDDVSKVPFLGDIPFLGTLFKKSTKDVEKAELLIFVTPRVLKQPK